MLKTTIFAIILGAIVSVISGGGALAETIKQPQIVPYKCTPTPSLKLNFPPTNEIGKTNNLWRKTGLAVPAVGKPVYIRGVVLDQNCVPVQGAVVQIWQGDAKGKIGLGEKSKEKIDPYFAGSGTTYTNNLGEYSFITIFPGADKDEVPYIRFRVKDRDFETIRTKMYFGNVQSDGDSDYKKFSDKERALVTAVSDPNGLQQNNNPITYYFNLTLLGKEAYKEY